MELNDLYVKRDSFKVNEKYDIEKDELNQLQIKIKEYDACIANILFEIDTLKSRVEVLNTKEFQENTDLISSVYEEAQMYNIEIKQKFEDTVKFHNTMLENEVVYLTKTIKDLMLKEESARQQRKNVADSYSVVLGKLAEYGSLATYTKLNNEIAELESQLGNHLSLQNQINNLNHELEKMNTELEKLSIIIESNMDKLRENLKVFNVYFSEYSKTLFGQGYYLSADLNKDGLHKFSVNAIDQNAGSGKRLSTVIAFDLAYTAFIQDEDVCLPYPNFCTQDKIETIDIQNLYKLSKLASQSNGQFLFPVISDKFEGLKDFEDKILITLSEKDKFFNIN